MDGSFHAPVSTLDLTTYTRQQHAFEQLEGEITELWGHINAATFRFLSLVAEYDRTKGYERHGLMNTAQWLNWQCGIGTVAAGTTVRCTGADRPARIVTLGPRDFHQVLKAKFGLADR